MRTHERFLKYIRYDTGSNLNSDRTPSTASQLEFARILAEEMKALGISDVLISQHGYVTGHIPANTEGRPVIGLIAHMDTVGYLPTVPMNARIIENYDGTPITLENGDILDPAIHTDVALARGKDLIVTDGRTILGADDKAGIAEILTACERILNDPSIPHGKIMIGFTPDEEIGRGSDKFDVKAFGADFAYTVDGGNVGMVGCENFNAAGFTVTVNGIDTHTGDAKNRLVNAILIASEFIRMLPPAEVPEHTEGYEGFYHLSDIKGSTGNVVLKGFLRDFDMQSFEARKAQLFRIAQYLNERHGENTVAVKVRNSYFNMRPQIDRYPHILSLAERAYAAVGVQMRLDPIRGGTDGARLSFMGLPCPNLSTGGMNFHSRFECIAVQDMDLMTDMLVHLVALDP